MRRESSNDGEEGGRGISEMNDDTVARFAVKRSGPGKNTQRKGEITRGSIPSSLPPWPRPGEGDYTSMLRASRGEKGEVERLMTKGDKGTYEKGQMKTIHIKMRAQRYVVPSSVLTTCKGCKSCVTRADRY